MAGHAGRPRRGLGSMPKEVECSKARGPHAILQGTARDGLMWKREGVSRAEVPCP